MYYTRTQKLRLSSQNCQGSQVICAILLGRQLRKSRVSSRVFSCSLRASVFPVGTVCVCVPARQQILRGIMEHVAQAASRHESLLRREGRRARSAEVVVGQVWQPFSSPKIFGPFAMPHGHGLLKATVSGHSSANTQKVLHHVWEASGELVWRGV